MRDSVINEAIMYKTTTVSVSVHRDGDNAIYGESVIRVSIEDESGGGFIVMQSGEEGLAPGQIRLDIEQLELVTSEAVRLVKDYEATPVRVKTRQNL